MVSTIINSAVFIAIVIILALAVWSQKEESHKESDEDMLDSILLNDLKEVTISSKRYTELLLAEIKLKEIKKTNGGLNDN